MLLRNVLIWLRVEVLQASVLSVHPFIYGLDDVSLSVLIRK